MHRFYLPNFQHPVLTGDEAHHCRDVLRLSPGATVTVFDGCGHEAQCEILTVGSDQVTLKLLQQFASPPLPCRITLAQAVPKKSMDLIVQKATELGVAVIQPLLSDRTIVQLDENATKLDRWRAIALESCKQCGNNWLPEIRPPLKAREFFNAPGQYDLAMIGSLQPGAQPLKKLLPPQRPATVLVVIGPEGDFTPAELAQALGAGLRPLSLGPLVLRAETAALYTISILHHELQVG